MSIKGLHLLHELEEYIQQLWYEGLHLLQALCVKGIYEASQRYHSVHPHLQQPTMLMLQTLHDDTNCSLTANVHNCTLEEQTQGTPYSSVCCVQIGCSLIASVPNCSIARCREHRLHSRHALIT